MTAETKQTMTVADAANEALSFIERRESDDQTSYYPQLYAPQWVYDLFLDNCARSRWGSYNAHTIIDNIAAGYIESRDQAIESADDMADAYLSQLLRWLHEDDEAIAFCDEALEEFGKPEDFSSLLGMAQSIQATRIAAGVFEDLEKRVMCVSCGIDPRMVGSDYCQDCIDEDEDDEVATLPQGVAFKSVILSEFLADHPTGRYTDQRSAATYDAAEVDTCYTLAAMTADFPVLVAAGSDIIEGAAENTLVLFNEEGRALWLYEEMSE